MALESEKINSESNPEAQRKSVIEEVIGPLSNNPVIDLLKYFRKRWWLVLVVWGGMALGVHEINSYFADKKFSQEKEFDGNEFNFNDLPDDIKEEELKKIERFHEEEFLKENNLPYELKSPPSDEKPENNPPDDDSDDETPPSPPRGIKISYA